MNYCKNCERYYPQNLAKGLCSCTDEVTKRLDTCALFTPFDRSDRDCLQCEFGEKDFSGMALCSAPSPGAGQVERIWRTTIAKTCELYTPKE